MAAGPRRPAGGHSQAPPLQGHCGRLPRALSLAFRTLSPPHSARLPGVRRALSRPQTRAAICAVLGRMDLSLGNGRGVTEGGAPRPRRGPAH